jgi:hypothetical protein
LFSKAEVLDYCRVEIHLGWDNGRPITIALPDAIEFLDEGECLVEI